MSNSTMIKKVIDAEEKASLMRSKALEESRLAIRNAEEEAGKAKEEAVKKARAKAREAMEKHQNDERAKTNAEREKQIDNNKAMQDAAKKNLPNAVKLIVDMACEVNN